MSAAIQTDRILIFDPEDSPGNTLVEETCGKHVGAKASLECVIEQLSSCASYATKENSIHQIDPSEVKDGKIRDTVPFAELAYSSYFGGSGVSPGGSVLRYWWRAQLYGYILRPNRAALERMTELRLNKTLHQGVETNRGNVEEVCYHKSTCHSSDEAGKRGGNPIANIHTSPRRVKFRFRCRLRQSRYTSDMATRQEKDV
ncbi:hypothetical protein TWF225_004436 [Orbilia oligospora]|nr:hypothetical protein TWF225_004436 [Orbilia oligospora]